ncbi:MAG: hypothetical protein VXZ82_09705 [Planctomycetota bacterium]|nr:hypothetical protein [Planctomycetota bacterium]
MPQLPETRISLVLRIAGSSDVQAWQEFAELYEQAIYGVVCNRPTPMRLTIIMIATH